MEHTNPEHLTQRFVAIWNETDDARRRTEVQALWADDGRHLMGQHDVRGHEALFDRVSGSHRHSVLEGRCTFRPPTAIQLLPGVVKFRWDMAHRDDGTVRAAGVGVLLLDGDGRIACDCLFTEA